MTNFLLDRQNVKRRLVLVAGTESSASAASLQGLQTLAHKLSQTDWSGPPCARHAPKHCAQPATDAAIATLIGSRAIPRITGRAWLGIFMAEAGAAGPEVAGRVL
jgi:hypothetical protein